MKSAKRIFFLSQVLLWNIFLSDLALSDDVKYVKTLFERITGLPLFISEPEYQAMLTRVQSGDRFSAAQVALANAKFYDITLRNWTTPLASIDGSQYVGLTDLQATIIGAIRDDLDARTLLTGNYYYRGADDLPIVDVSRSNNNHYLALDTGGYSLARNLVQASPQWTNFPESAGVLTSRGWAAAHYVAGTNRRALQYTFQNFLCAPIEKWKQRGLPAHFIRRDVNRKPGGDPFDFQNRCRSCHAPMDAMAGAFSRLDFVNNELVHYGFQRVAPKYNQNIGVYPEGYITESDNWINYATQNENETYFGWRGELEGRGIQQFAKMVANSRAFGRCMTTRVFTEVCRRAPASEEGSLIESLTDEFESQGYSLKRLFASVASNNACIAHAL